MLLPSAANTAPASRAVAGSIPGSGLVKARITCPGRTISGLIRPRTPVVAMTISASATDYAGGSFGGRGGNGGYSGSSCGVYGDLFNPDYPGSGGGPDHGPVSGGGDILVLVEMHRTDAS